MSFGLINCENEHEVLFNESLHGWGTTDKRWFELLALAVAHGWDPEGTTLPGVDDWYDRPELHYSTNSGQTVSTEDAANMADAIERHLQSLDIEENDRAFFRGFVRFARLGAFAIC